MYPKPLAFAIPVNPKSYLFFIFTDYKATPPGYGLYFPFLNNSNSITQIS